MKNKLKKSQKFSLLTAFYITLLQTLLLSVFLYIFTDVDLYFLYYWALFSFVFTSVLIHLRLEKYVFNSIKKIYKDLTLLESTTFNN
ncbi:MAG: sensor histidine kinase, partial [Flavobacteriaceae bacterium]